MKTTTVKMMDENFDKLAFASDVHSYIKEYMNEGESLTFDINGQLVTFFSNLEESYEVVLFEILEGHDFELV